MGKMIDLSGCRFGRLVAIKPVGQTRYKNFLWLCKCDCGQETVVAAGELRKKNSGTKSCGCLARDITAKRSLIHGDAAGGHIHGPYHSWMCMKSRCTYKKDAGYKNYGGRGISFCDEWKNYLTFRAWALENGWKNGLTLDRIDNDKGYCPDNCRWVTKADQNRNQRRTVFVTLDNEKISVAEAARKLGVHQNTLNRWVKSMGERNAIEKARKHITKPKKHCSATGEAYVS